MKKTMTKKLNVDQVISITTNTLFTLSNFDVNYIRIIDQQFCVSGNFLGSTMYLLGDVDFYIGENTCYFKAENTITPADMYAIQKVLEFLKDTYSYLDDEV